MPDPEGAQSHAMPLRLLHRAESEVPIRPDADVIRTGMNVNVGPIASVKVRGAFENDRDAVQLTEWLCNLCHRRPLWKCLEIGHHSPEWKEEVGRRVHRKTARHDDRGPARAPSDVSKHVSPSSSYQASRSSVAMWSRLYTHRRIVRSCLRGSIGNTVWGGMREVLSEI